MNKQEIDKVLDIIDTVIKSIKNPDVYNKSDDLSQIFNVEGDPDNLGGGIIQTLIKIWDEDKPKKDAYVLSLSYEKIPLEGKEDVYLVDLFIDNMEIRRIDDSDTVKMIINKKIFNKNTIIF